MSLLEDMHIARKERLMRLGAITRPVPRPPIDQSAEKIKDLTEKLAESHAVNSELRGVIQRQRQFIQRFADESEVPLARMNDIIMTVADHFKLTKANLVGEQRPARIVVPRQICYYIAHKIGHSFPVIGRSVNKDHSSVVHGYYKIKERIEADPAFAAEITAIEAKVAAYVAARVELSQAVLAS